MVAILLLLIYVSGVFVFTGTAILHDSAQKSFASGELVAMVVLWPCTLAYITYLGAIKLLKRMDDNEF